MTTLDEHRLDLAAKDAQIAALRDALKEIGREQSAKTATEAADKFQRLARTALEMRGGVK